MLGVHFSIMGMPATEARLSELFSMALDADADGTVSLEEVLMRAGDRSYGVMLLLLAIPCFIPVLPPGTSGVVGAFRYLPSCAPGT